MAFEENDAKAGCSSFPFIPSMLMMVESSAPLLCYAWLHLRGAHYYGDHIYPHLVSQAALKTACFQGTLREREIVVLVSVLYLTYDTKQLMLLMYPGGIVYHTSSEEAKVENARLKDENARLHAAVWVLRDNPSLQADSTVAAIFRLSDTQFIAKFQSDVPASDKCIDSTSNKFQYQNNRVKRRSYRTSLDLGNEPPLAIYLTNRPIKDVCPTCNKFNCKERRRQGSSASIIQHQDFTSNWKPTTPHGDENTRGQVQTSSEGQMRSDWAVLSWHQNYSFKPADVHALDKTQSIGDGRYCKHFTNCLQTQEAIGNSLKAREFRRSNSVSRGGNILAERISKAPSHAVPIKCVSFVEPLPSCQTYSPVECASICFRDKVEVILDDKHDHSYCSTSKKEQHSHQGADAVAECGLKDVSSGITCQQSDKSADVYTVASTREPSKRCFRDTATSPVLDTRTCFFILGQQNQSRLPKHDPFSKDYCRASASDDYMLNKSNNNDHETTKKPSTFDNFMLPCKPQLVRPFSAKQRNLRQTRMKNLQASEKLNSNVKQVATDDDPKVTCSTNNALGKDKRRSTLIPRAKVSSKVTVVSDGKLEDIEERRNEVVIPDGSSWYVKRSFSPSDLSDTNTRPKIFYSNKPAPEPLKRHTPYAVTSYNTVKHFLDRHRRLMMETTNSKFNTEFFTREITPSVDQLNDKTSPTIKQHDNVVSNGSAVDMYLSTSSVSRGDSYTSDVQHQRLDQKYKAKWCKSKDVSADKCVNDNDIHHQPLQNYPTAGISKDCDKLLSGYSTMEKLKELKKLGKYQFSKPLATMIKRNGLYQHPDHLLIGSRLFENRMSPNQKVQVKLPGPLITFIYSAGEQ